MRRTLLLAGISAIALSPLTLAVVLSACAEHRNSPAQCGPSPLPPGWVVDVFLSGNGPLACMAVDDYSKIILFREAVEVWSACIEGRRE